MFVLLTAAVALINLQCERQDTLAALYILVVISSCSVTEAEMQLLSLPRFVCGALLTAEHLSAPGRLRSTVSPARSQDCALLSMYSASCSLLQLPSATLGMAKVKEQCSTGEETDSMLLWAA